MIYVWWLMVRRRSCNIKKQLFLDANILDEYVLWRLSIIGYPCSFLLGVISSTFYIKSKQATNFVNSITVCYTLEKFSLQSICCTKRHVHGTINLLYKRNICFNKFQVVILIKLIYVWYNHYIIAAKLYNDLQCCVILSPKYAQCHGY